MSPSTHATAAFTHDEAEAVADALWATFNGAPALDALDPRPQALADGYAAQRALERRAGPAVGWKLA